MLNFTQALEQLRMGKKLRRTTWGYVPGAYLQISKWMGEDFVYLHDSIPRNPNHIVAHGFQLPEIDATDWEIGE